MSEIWDWTWRVGLAVLGAVQFVLVCIWVRRYWIRKTIEWQFDRAVETPCSEGRCTDLIDPKTGKNIGGWGNPYCPCQDGADR